MASALKGRGFETHCGAWAGLAIAEPGASRRPLRASWEPRMPWHDNGGTKVHVRWRGPAHASMLGTFLAKKAAAHCVVIGHVWQ